MFQDMVWAIIFSNVAALLVSVTFIPMLASKFMKKNIIQTEGKYFSKIQRKYSISHNEYRTYNHSLYLVTFTNNYDK